jgi:hypothetical protein
MLCPDSGTGILREIFIVWCNFRMEGNGTWELNEEPRFSLLAVCKDRLIGVRAKHFYDRPIKEIEDECGFSFDPCIFGVLASSGVMNSAGRSLGRRS